MDEILAFLRAQLAEDKRLAEAAAADAGAPSANPEPEWEAASGCVLARGIIATGHEGGMDLTIADHIARHDPRSVLADVAMKQGMIDDYEEMFRSTFMDSETVDTLGKVIRWAATAYQHRPGFKAEWRIHG